MVNDLFTSTVSTEHDLCLYYTSTLYLCSLSPKQEDCEKAYFKMDNVLIDDRRIHVDFSQSVAKIRWKGKGTLTEGSMVCML